MSFIIFDNALVSYGGVECIFRKLSKSATHRKCVGLSCSDKTPAALFFRYNTQLGPPYQIIIDTNFINFSIRNKIDVVEGMMDCLYAECKPCITDCVLAELEKLGQKYRLALKIAKVSADLLHCVRTFVCYFSDPLRSQTALKKNV